MAKEKKDSTVFKCSSCGFTQPRWLGRCPECGSWNTFVEMIVERSQAKCFADKGGEGAAARLLSDVDAMEGKRILTGMDEFDRVLGGGAMMRSATLIGGEPGIGKSTLLLQISALVQNARNKPAVTRILYVSGEESASQIRARADRLKLPLENISVLCTMSLLDVENAMRKLNPQLVAIDSIQTLYAADAGSIPGTVAQLKLCAYELVSAIKEKDAILLMSAHVTKDGLIAGPKTLEHIVDTVISFERSSDDVRLLRAQKNRFGSIDEIGVFGMNENGLSPIADASTMFITQRKGEMPPGIAIAPVYEGSRVFLVEIQALTIPTKTAVNRVTSEKIEAQRVMRVAAILEKRLGVRLSDHDIFVNVAGGVRLNESAIDLALAAAIYSARCDVPCPGNLAFAGEISLAGEVRPVSHLKQRVKTACNLGFSHVAACESGDGLLSISTISQIAEILK